MSDSLAVTTVTHIVGDGVNSLFTIPNPSLRDIILKVYYTETGEFYPGASFNKGYDSIYVGFGIIPKPGEFTVAIIS